MFVAVRVSSLSFLSQPLGSRSRSHGRSPRQLPRTPGYKQTLQRKLLFAPTDDRHVGRIGARALLLEPHWFLAGSIVMDDPFPVDVLQMPLFAGAYETNWRHVRFLAVIEHESSPPPSDVEVLPADQPSTAPRVSVTRIGLDLLANEECGEYRGDNVARQTAWAAIVYWWSSKR